MDSDTAAGAWILVQGLNSVNAQSVVKVIIMLHILLLSQYSEEEKYVKYHGKL